jgi:hypothetical protein
MKYAKQLGLTLAAGLTCCLPNQAWSFFPSADDTLTVSMFIDVAADSSAVLTPFVLTPGGDATILESVAATGATMVQLAPIELETAYQGEYTCGVLVEPTTNGTTVAINTDNSSFTAVNGTTLRLAPSDPQAYSVTGDVGASGTAIPLHFTAVYLLPPEQR